MKAREGMDTDKLASLWLEQREIQNLMGRYVSYRLKKKDISVFDVFWSKFEEDVCIGVNEGWYIGRDAVEGYFQKCHENTQTKSALIQELFPSFLSNKTKEEIHGVGQLDVDAICSPIIEISGYGTTAKGVWLFLGARNDLFPGGPYSLVENGYYAVDFIKEGTNWKIWHLQRICEFSAPDGVNWAAEWQFPSLVNDFSSLDALVEPPFTQRQCVREIYRPDRTEPDRVRIPEPFYDFSETFSYGYTGNSDGSIIQKKGGHRVENLSK